MGSKITRKLLAVMIALTMIVTSGAAVFAATGSPSGGTTKPATASSLNTEGNYGSKSIKAVWKGANADSYTIAYRAKGGSWKYIKNVKNKTTTIKNLANKGKYEIKVAPVKKGKTGKWTNVSYRYIAKTKMTKAKAGKKKVTVKWKKFKGATGYVIQYSTNKNFSGAKSVTVGKKATKKTIKKLTKGKTYYFRVIPIYNSGHKYWGIQSNVKSAKVK